MVRVLVVLVLMVGVTTTGQARGDSVDLLAGAQPHLSDDEDVAAMQMNRRTFGAPSDEATTLARLSEVIDGRAVLFEGTPMSPDERAHAETLLEIELVAESVAAALADYDNFAGVWVNRDLGHSVHVAFVGPPPSSSSAILDRLAGIPHVVTQRTFTVRELEADYTLMASTLVNYGLHVDTSMSIRMARLEVEGAPAQLHASQLVLSGLGLRVPIAYTMGTTSAGEAAHALFGGLRTAKNSSYAWNCTLGLPFETVNGGHPRPTSAEHGGCGSNITHYRATDAVAIRITGVDSGHLDASVLGPLGGSILTDDIIIYHNNQIHSYRDIFGESEPTEGSTICESQGSSTMSRCGPITDSSAGYGDNWGMYRATMCSQGGDSGSAAYKPVGVYDALGVGNHSGGTDNGATCAPADRVFVGKAKWIRIAWDLALKTS